jgi:hypothetical protein
MKNSLRKGNRKTYRRINKKGNKKTHRRHKANNRRTRRHSGGFINASHIANAYNTATQAYQGLNDAYSGLQEKYQESMQHYDTIKQKYDEMKNTLSEIANDPAVQKHLDTISTLHSQLSNSITPTTTHSGEDISPEEKMVGGFFNSSSLSSFNNSSLSSLNNAYKSANTSLANKKQQFDTVYKHPEVQKNIKDLSSHSYNTAKQGALLGVNVAAAAPFSSAYRGYTTYSAAKKGIKSAKNLYSSASDVYKTTIPQEAPPQEVAPQEAPPQEVAPQEAPPQEVAPQEAPPQEAAPQEAPPQENI